MKKLKPYSVIPQFEDYQTEISQYSFIPSCSPMDLQIRLQLSLDRLYHIDSKCNILILNAVDTYTYYELLREALENQHPSKAVGEILVADTFDEDDLFGFISYDKKTQTLHQEKGLLHHANHGTLVLSLTQLLQSPALWFKLRNTIAKQTITWQRHRNSDPCPLPEAIPLTVKIILIGDRYQLATLESIDVDIFQSVIFGEFESELCLTSSSIKTYLGLIQHYQTKYLVKPLSSSGVQRIMQAGVRFSEDQSRVPLCPLWFQNLFEEIAVQMDKSQPVIEGEHIQSALVSRYQRVNYWPERALDDIHFGQVFIDTEGEHIGQVNGLTVIEIPGHPVAYGEPARISCVVHFGDGDIADVERKAELGGNIHAKGMMIMQAFVSAALNLDHPLPFSASIVFEQSYSEVDGDSASLAELCAFVSALAHHPINQEIAITGAVDQFGRVQAVGGINEKIEGFYKICAHRGLTGNQGVLLPKTNRQSLCLNADVAEAIEAGQFHIWAVENVEEALPLVTGLAFKEKTNEDEETLLDKISERILALTEGDDSHVSFFQRLKKWLNFD